MKEEVTDFMEAGLRELALQQIEKITKKQIELLEMYLTEYCEVHSVKEEDLKNFLEVRCDSETCNISVVGISEQQLKIGISINSVTEGKPSIEIEVFGSFIAEKDTYPKTAELLETLNKE